MPRWTNDEDSYEPDPYDEDELDVRMRRLAGRLKGRYDADEWRVMREGVARDLMLEHESHDDS